MARPDLELSVGLKAADVEAAAAETRQKLAQLFKELEGKPTNDRIDNLLASLKAADSAIEDLTNNIDNKLKVSGTMLPNFEEVVDSITAANRKLRELGEHLTAQTKYAEKLKLELALVKVEGFESASYSEASSQTAYGKLRNDLIALTEDYAELDQSRKAVEANMNKLQTAIQENVSAMGNLYEAAKRTNEPELWSQLDRQSDYVRTLKQEYAKLIPEYERIEQRQTRINNTAERYAEGMQEVYTSTMRAYSSASAQRLGSIRSGITKINDAIAKQKSELETLEQTRLRLINNRLDFDNFENAKSAVPDIEELENIVNQATVNMHKLNQEFGKMPQIVDLTKAPVRSLREFLVQGLSAIAGAVENTLDSIVRTLPPFIQVVYSLVKYGVKLVINEFVTTAKQVATVIKNSVIKVLNAATTAAKNFAKALAKAASNVVLSPFKKLGDAIGNIGKKASDSDFSMKKFGRAILQYGIGVRSLYRLINKLRTALFEGFADLALAYEPFNESMSQIVTALNYLKNSFAAAFAPIIQYVAPVLSIFVTKIAEAVQWIGQLIAALTGKEFVMALPVFKDYSEETKAGAAAAKEQAQAEKQAKKAAEDEAKAEKKRNKALEKLQRTIAGFDDVELLKDKSDTDADDNYGFDPDKYDFSTPTLDAALQTFKVGGPIQAGIKQFADLLKKAWQTADAYNLGKLVSEQLKNLLEQFYHALPKIQEFFGKVARVIASFLAGFLSVPDTFKWLGLAISGVINTIFKTIQEFLRTFISYDGFKNLGKAIYNTIVVALANINWETIYDVFRMMGTGIAQVLNETVAKPEFWQNIFITLTNALRAILIRVVAFATTLHWGEIGSALAAGIIAGIENFPLEEAINAVVSVLDGLWQLFINFVNGMEGHWREIGQTVAQFIIGLFKNFEPVEFVDGVIQFLDGLWEAFMGFVETPGWDQVVDKIGTAISEFAKKFIWDGKRLDGFIGFLNNAIDKLKNLLDKLHIPELFDKLFTYLKNSKEFQELCEKIVDLVIYFTKLKIQAKIEAFKGIGGILLNYIGEGVKSNIKDQAYNSAEEEARALGFELKNREGDIKDSGAGLGSAMNDGIASQTSTIVDTAGGISSSMQDEFKKGDYGLIMSEHGNSMLTGIDNFRPDTTGAIRQVSDEMQAALASGDWEEVMRVNAQSGATGISNNSHLVTDEVGTMIQSINDIFTNMDWSVIGNGIIDGIYYALTSGWSWLYDTVWNLAGDLLNAAKGALGIASPSKAFKEAVGKMIPAGIGIGIEANADSALGAVDDLSEGLVNTAKNIKIPPIAMGEVIPYNIANGQNDTNVTLNSLLDVIQSLESSMLTREDLDVAIATIIRNLPDYYIGAEKLARIVNKGNSMLDRRYNPVST